MELKEAIKLFESLSDEEKIRFVAYMFGIVECQDEKVEEAIKQAKKYSIPKSQ